MTRKVQPFLNGLSGGSAVGCAQYVYYSILNNKRNIQTDTADADLLLIDEADGRAVAGRMGIQYTGLLGVLLEAKTRELLSAVSTELDRLQETTNFRIRPEVRREVLRLAGEL